MKYISIKQPWIVFVLELKQAFKNRKITIYPSLEQKHVAQAPFPNSKNPTE
uniref:Uncharacterized protein n=1 Tax=Anguilla anguilla TaxID=7936 RepID=A0A0E9PLU1_ANGAN